MTEATEHPAPRKRGRPRNSEKKTAKKPERNINPHAARDTLGELLEQVWRAAGFARVEQADEVHDLATEAHGLAIDIDELLTHLRRELHIVLGTRVDNDTTLPRDIVNVLDYIGGAAESLQQAADGIVSAVEWERKR